MNKWQLRIQLIRKLLFFLIPTQEGRVKYIKKHNLFAGIGDNCFWQPRTLPTDPKCVRLHNNVSVATGAKFFNHDMLYDLFNHMDGGGYNQKLGCIEVMDNVMIGGNVIIMPNIRIGPNAVIAGGSVVTKDVPEGVIVGGNPAKVIGSFEELKLKSKGRYIEGGRQSQVRISQAWKEFEERRRQ